MIEIKKGREPKALTTYRQQKYATYDNMPSEIKSIVLKQLMEEQGHLCAYCMGRIPQNNASPAVSIEHWEAQSENDIEMGLNYKNMLAVCPGNRGCGSKNNLTCDARKDNHSVSVNPLKPETLSEIGYKSDGIIFSTDSNIDEDLNLRLNLNCTAAHLPENRKAALQRMQRVLKKKYPKGEIKQECKRLLEHYCKENSNKVPYVGILIFWLKKHV